jgi:small-conductance mechanosensitive channel
MPNSSPTETPENTNSPHLSEAMESDGAITQMQDAATQAVVEPIENVADTVNKNIQGTVWENVTLWDNSIVIWMISIGLFIVAYFGLRLLVGLVLKQVQKTNIRQIQQVNLAKQAAVTCLALISWQFYLLMAISLAAIPLHLPENVAEFIHHLPLFALLIQTGIWLKPLINLSLGHYVMTRATPEERKGMQTLVGPLRFIIFTFTWSLLLVIGLDNVGVNVTALVTSLGIGGIAIGLALQNVLSDLFASLSIALDKPFVVDEFIISNDFMGTVKHIGLKSTRLESIGGEHIVIPNSDLTSSRLRNYTRMKRRRMLSTLDVSRQTPLETLKLIPQWMQETVEHLGEVTFERAHLTLITDHAFQFELVYHVEHDDYTFANDKQQTYLFNMLQQFEENGVMLALPSHQLHLAQTPTSPEKNLDDDEPDEDSLPNAGYMA